MCSPARDGGPPLEVNPILETLEKTDKLYAHHMARAAWHGSRIILQQVSAESPVIFDFIRSSILPVGETGIPSQRDATFFPRNWMPFWSTLPRFSATWANSACVCFTEQVQVFLFPELIPKQGDCDQKFIPDMTVESLRKMAAISPQVRSKLEMAVKPLLAVPPYALGYPGTNALSNYYPSAILIPKTRLPKASVMMERLSIGPENTRILLMPGSTTASGRTTVSKTSFMRIALPSTTTRISLATASSPPSSSASKPVRTLSDFSPRPSTSLSATELASLSVKLSPESTTSTSRARPSALSLEKP